MAVLWPGDTPWEGHTAGVTSTPTSASQHHHPSSQPRDTFTAQPTLKLCPGGEGSRDHLQLCWQQGVTPTPAGAGAAAATLGNQPGPAPPWICCFCSSPSSVLTQTRSGSLLLTLNVVPRQVGALYEHNTPVVTIPMSYGGTRVFPPCRREESSKRGRQKPEQCSHPSELMHTTKPTTKRIIFPSRQSSRCSVLLKSPQQLIAG